MWDFFSTTNWAQTDWLRWNFAILILVVGYAGSQTVSELRRIRVSLEEIRSDLTNR